MHICIYGFVLIVILVASIIIFVYKFRRRGRMYANGRSVVITGNIYLLVTIFVLFFELDNKFIAWNLLIPSIWIFCTAKITFLLYPLVPRPGKVPGYNRILKKIKGTGVPHSSIERATIFLHGTKLRLLFVWHEKSEIFLQILQTFLVKNCGASLFI